MYSPPASLMAIEAAVTAVAVGAALYAWSLSRDRRRITVAVIASVAGFLLWRAALIVANGANLDVDYDALLGLSFEDIGSGVMAFLFTALGLGLVGDRTAPAERVVRAAALAGAVTMLIDRFI